jgi:signal transduction histidine kinase
VSTRAETRASGTAGRRFGEAVEVGFVRTVAETLGPGVSMALVVESGERSPTIVGAWPPDSLAATGAALAALGGTPFRDDAPAVDASFDAGRLVIVAPVRAPGMPAAALVGVAGEGRTALEPGETRLLEACARMGALMLRCIEKREEGDRSRDRAARLVEAGMAIGAGLELRDVLMRLLEASREVIGARYAALGVLNEDHTGLSDFLWSGIGPDEARAIGNFPRGRGILGALIRDVRPLRLDDLSDDPRAVGWPPNHPPMSSFLGVPLAIGGEVFGNLYLTEKIDGTFTDEDEQIALTLAAQAAAAVDKVRRFEREQRRVAELESVQEVAAATLRTLDLDSLVPLLARRARQLTDADLVAVGLVDSGNVTIRFAHGEGALDLEGMILSTDDRGVADALRGAVGADHCELAWLTIGGERVGVLAACGDRPFDESARRLLDTFSIQAAIAVANAKTFAEERARLLESAEVVAARERERAAEEGLRRAISAQEAERARIARELHDEAGQVLTALAVQLRAIEDHIADQRARERLAELRSLVNSASSGLRSLAMELRPSGLRERGLAAAIARQADRVHETSGIRVDLALDALPGNLTDEVQIAIFRVIQEALTNVARHSGAGRASILATRRGPHLRVVVEDDGAGFNPSMPTGRLGIGGMRERMELIGGEFRVESTPGSGAAVIIDLEVSRE